MLTISCEIQAQNSNAKDARAELGYAPNGKLWDLSP